jgi:hypothetical protein
MSRSFCRALFFDHLIAERDAFRVVLLEPLIGKLWRREYLEVVDVANLLVGVDIDPIQTVVIGPS